VSASVAAQPASAAWRLPNRGTVGMLLFIAAETSLFAIFLSAYLYYIGKSLSGPTPREVLHFPVGMTVCLLSSSVTIHFATQALHRGAARTFAALWLVTILLGVAFLTGTAQEWRELIVVDHLTIHTNLFGTTYYSLVGLHASHVIAGLLLLSIAMLFALAGRIRPTDVARLEVISIYWHFVDAVWVVVVTVVYVIGR
jgi:cytochrome c oxidase subunit 3/cytochrome o ubiquinol oxidase subunit 3